MSYKIIVSRYKENLDWATKYQNVIIYNKGPTLFKASSSVKIIDLPNVGCEAHTYLSYIISNYDKLPDYVFFLKGDPNHNCRELHQRLSNAIKEITDGSAKEFITLTDIKNKAAVEGSPGLPFREVHEFLFGTPQSEKTFEFGSGAQFVVSRKLIQSRSKDFYKKVHKLLAYAVNPIEGYVIERLWPTIFSVD